MALPACSPIPVGPVPMPCARSRPANVMPPHGLAGAVPWTKASYSFAAPGEVTTMGPILHKGIEDRLHFAGEHACYKFAGYMEGALTSGLAVARRLALRDGATIDSTK